MYLMSQVDLQVELQTLKDKLEAKDKSYALEIEKYKESNEKQLHTIERLQNKVREERERVTCYYCVFTIGDTVQDSVL